jgi:hypothetical protein
MTKMPNDSNKYFEKSFSGGRDSALGLMKDTALIGSS